MKGIQSKSLCAIAASLIVALMACSDGTRRQSPTLDSPAASGPAEQGAGAEHGQVMTPEAEGTGEGTGESAGTASAAGTAATETPGAASAAGAEAEETDETPAVVIDIFDVMTGAGFERLSEEDLADYLPVPPRSEGQVGRFGWSEEVVTVARVTYPAEAFADPHERWILERIELLPEAHERVLRRGATVIHINAESAPVAQRALDALTAAAEGEGL